MSKNRNIRNAGIELPPYPKFNANGRVMRDNRGEIIYEDHFRVISEFRQKAREEATDPNVRRHIEDRLVMEYMKKVKTYKLYLRRKLIKRTIIISALVIISITFILIKYT